MLQRFVALGNSWHCPLGWRLVVRISHPVRAAPRPKVAASLFFGSSETCSPYFCLPIAAPAAFGHLTKAHPLIGSAVPLPLGLSSCFDWMCWPSFCFCFRYGTSDCFPKSKDHWRSLLLSGHEALGEGSLGVCLCLAKLSEYFAHTTRKRVRVCVPTGQTLM